MNYFKTTLLIGALTALFMWIGYLLGGSNGAIIALIFAGGMNFMAFWNSDKIVLKMTGSILADRNQNKDYYEIVERLVNKANMPMPKLYIMNNSVPNAFATGRNPKNAAVAITTGLYQMLNKDELAGVIAHELAHIEHRDTLISTITATFAGAISMIANMFMFMSLFGGREDNRLSPIISIVVMIVAPMVAVIIQMAVSRNREYYADKRGGELVDNPLFLASALKKLENYSQSIRKNAKYTTEQSQKTAATSHMYIVNHFSGNKDGLFSTHPHTANRVAALEKQANALGIFSYTPSSSTTTFNTNNDDTFSKPVASSVEKSDSHIKNNPWA
ncbi:MAG: zinc metalloprotease HtpX [Alphaproteobacteria bacterium]|jgi:heat shock protein HtpX|nr:zinc metalloprotease HtpX [Alphaproteobacteria bacterium]